MQEDLHDGDTAKLLTLVSFHRPQTVQTTFSVPGAWCADRPLSFPSVLADTTPLQSSLVKSPGTGQNTSAIPTVQEEPCQERSSLGPAPLTGGRSSPGTSKGAVGSR